MINKETPSFLGEGVFLPTNFVVFIFKVELLLGISSLRD